MIAIGLLVVVAIGFGIWLWSIRSVADPVEKNPVDAYAVVVSSPSCTAGNGSTVIDLSISPPVRSSISACGRRVGERIAVQYLAGQPDLAGTAVAHNNSARSWLPIAILAAGLLAVIGILSLLIDRHRSRHDSRDPGAGERLTVAQLRAGAADSASPAAGPTGITTGTTTEGRHARPAGATVDPPTADTAESFGPDTPTDTSPDTTTRIASGTVPGIGSTPLRSSDIVDEDLFTHRTHHPG